MRGFKSFVAFAALSAGLAAPASADEVELTDLVEVLREEGVIDEDQAARMRSTAQRREDEQKWTDRFSMWGDFRLRYEQFWRDEDKTRFLAGVSGGDGTDRTRARYRLRLNLQAEVNDYMNVFVRLATGEDDSRSTNTSFGKPNQDFSPDGIYIDRAYLEVKPFRDGEVFGQDADLVLQGGRMPNPFLWKQGKDYMLWDHDIQFEGAGLKTRWHLGKSANVFFNTGVFVLDENNRNPSRDPSLWAGQLGGELEATEAIRFGTRTSFYNFYSLDPSFFERGLAASKPNPSDGRGNLVDYLAAPGRYGLSDDERVQVLELGGFVDFDRWEAWPIRLYGHWSKNFSARSVLGAGKQDMAWMLGLEAGDKQELVRLGVVYAWIEANAFPSQFIDSDLFDGVTNRRGWSFYGSRQILENTDFNLSVFLSDPIEQQYVPFAGDPGDGYEAGNSITDSKRVRLQADVVVKF